MICNKYKELKLVCNNKLTKKLTELCATPKGLGKIKKVRGSAVNHTMYVHFYSDEPFDTKDFEMYELSNSGRMNVSDVTLHGILYKFLHELIVGEYEIKADCECNHYELTLSFSCFPKGMDRKYTMNIIFNALLAPNYDEYDEGNENEETDED